jgi:hypothetical protein
MTVRVRMEEVQKNTSQKIQSRQVVGERAQPPHTFI